MMYNRGVIFRWLVSGVLLLALFFSCSRFNKIKRKGTWRDKYDAAVNYYDEGEYAKANVLLEDILLFLGGSEVGEKGYFYYASSFFHIRRYILSAYYYKEFYETYPRSRHVEEAVFMYGKSLYRSTYPYYYDQGDTYKAIGAIQDFIERYSGSDFRSEAQSMIEEMQERLAKKSFETAFQYYKVGYYRAAVLAFEDFHKTFSSSSYVEESWKWLIISLYEIAERTIPARQKHRYKEVIGYYERYVRRYDSGSAYYAELRAVYEKCLRYIEV